MENRLEKAKFDQLSIDDYFWRHGNPVEWIKLSESSAISRISGAYASPIELSGDEEVSFYNKNPTPEIIKQIIEWTGNPDPDY